MAEMSEQKKKQVAVIGGGLVGSLDALYFAKEGYDVHVFDIRRDPRKEKFVEGRSINLALSVRGRESLRGVGAEDHVVKGGIAMYARMIHSLDGKKSAQPYGKKDQYILSIDRRKLNEHLISEADPVSNITYHFNHKFVNADLDSGRITFQNTMKEGDSAEVEFKADFIAGNDGAFSVVRRLLMKKNRMNYRQEYIPHGYKEIQMPPTENGEFMMEENYLHIWPRNTFMMIALPNQDKTFTCTLFLPFETFDKIKTEVDIMNFFEKEFPDSIPLIGRKKLVEEYKKNPVGSMISVKCSPYHYKSKCVIKGDAAHAMVPFYGQGMNCGLEDCLVFHQILEKNEFDFEATLPEYSATRNPDAEAMCDLAMYNYIEMRASVNSRYFLFKKKIDNFLNWIMPRTWIPLYTMVTFSRIRYHTVIAKSKQQDKILNWSITGVSCIAGGISVALIWKRLNASERLTDVLSNLNLKAFLSKN